MQNTRLSWLFAVLMTSLLALAGCVEEDPYIHCPFSNTIEKTCVQNKDAVGFTCVVASHPFCSEKICVSWVESDPFCSRGCEADGDCPNGGRCVEHLDNPSNPDVPSRVCVTEATLCGDGICQDHEASSDACNADCD